LISHNKWRTEAEEDFWRMADEDISA
jgi:hypothetical protein